MTTADLSYIESHLTVAKFLDFLYNSIENLLQNSEFDAINQLLSAETDNLSTNLIIGLLTTTLAAKSKLPARSNFFYRAETTLLKRGEEVEMLAGLD